MVSEGNYGKDVSGNLPVKADEVTFNTDGANIDTSEQSDNSCGNEAENAFSGNGRTKIWVYAVVLFTSAFIVLLLTAYSQLKFNKNLSEYKEKVENFQTQISSKETEKNKVKTNLNAVIEDNAKLEKTIKELGNKLDELKKTIEDNNNTISELKNQLSTMASSHYMLMKAENEYKKGNIIKTAFYIRNIDNNLLFEPETLSLYKSLYNKTIYYTAKYYYSEGYKLYKSRHYSDAAKAFENSLYYSENEYFSDDCIYFLILTGERTSDTELRDSNLVKLTEKYPQSEILNYQEIKKLLELLEKQ